MNQVEYLGPSKISDSSLELLSVIIEIIRFSDPDFKTKVICNPEKVIVHITPSNQDYKKEIIDNLLWINKHLGIKITFSKSLAISHIISFEIVI